MPSEKAKDEAPEIIATQKYKLIYFNSVDCARTSIEERFNPNKEILKDWSLLDPKKFNETVKVDSFPPEVLCRISELSKFHRSLLIIELKQFAGQYENFI